MTYAIAEGLVQQTNVLHGSGLALLHVEFDTFAPVYVGDTVDVIAEFLESRPTSGNRGVVVSRHTVRNQRRERVFEYTATRLISGR
jgi:acyl dehydratase